MLPSAPASAAIHLVMQLVGKLASFVGIDPSELRTAMLMLAHSFAMGLTTVFFETAASALFLSHFESSTLPWVYLAAAATSAATGVVYTNLLGRLSFRRLMLGTLGFLFLTTLALRVGLWLAPAGGLLFAILVWYRVISILTDLEYWAVATRLYDVRQAKRLYPFIGSGEVVARISGAFSVPLFLAIMGVANLLLLSAAAAAASMGMLALVLRGKSVDAAAETKRKEKNEWGLLEPLRAVTGTTYLRLLVSIAFFAVLGKYFVDFAFLAEMRGRFTEVKEPMNRSGMTTLWVPTAKVRASNSLASSSLKALPMDSMGTSCRCGENGPSTGAPTRWVGLSSAMRSGWASSRAASSRNKRSYSASDRSGLSRT